MASPLLSECCRSSTFVGGLRPPCPVSMLSIAPLDRTLRSAPKSADSPRGRDMFLRLSSKQGETSRSFVSRSSPRRGNAETCGFLGFLCKNSKTGQHAPSHGNNGNEFFHLCRINRWLIVACVFLVWHHLHFVDMLGQSRPVILFQHSLDARRRLLHPMKGQICRLLGVERFDVVVPELVPTHFGKAVTGFVDHHEAHLRVL